MIVNQIKSKYDSQANSVHGAPCVLKKASRSAIVVSAFHSKHLALWSAPSCRENSRREQRQWYISICKDQPNFTAFERFVRKHILCSDSAFGTRSLIMAVVGKTRHLAHHWMVTYNC